MIYEVDAVYEDGVLKPSRTIPIRDGARVKIIILSEQANMLDIALHLLKRGEVSVSLAAKIAGMDYRSFLEEMGRRGVNFPCDEKELEKEIDINDSN